MGNETPCPQVEATVASRLRLVARPGASPLGAIFGGIGVAGGLAVGLLHLDRLPFTICTFKAMTGLPCFSCGGTRVFGRLFALDVPGALAMNPAVALGVFVLALWALGDLVLLPRGRALRLELPPAALRVAQVGAVIAVVVNWVYLLLAGR